MTAPTVILVTGTRNLTDLEPVRHALAPYEYPVLLMHGAARGLDTLAGLYATQRGWGCLPMPAQWARDGRTAGPKRNRAMLNVVIALENCGYRAVCRAFPGPRSRGTWDMVRRARAAGLEVHVHEIDT